jgi:capsular polysaccharide transport system ATP-binding protein
MIELRHVTKTYRTPYGPNVVLDDVSVELPPRESIGILGRNGAGKSTLLRIIGGAEMPDAGDVLRGGKVSWPIGFTGGFNTTLTGEENCRFIARIYGEEVDRVVAEAAEFAEIGDYFYMPVRTYSSGMRARLAFGVSMSIDFDVYLVDEITMVGDQRFRHKCRDAFAERRDRASLVMVSHQLDALREYCRRGAFLEGGTLRVFETVDEAAAAYDEACAA